MNELGFKPIDDGLGFQPLSEDDDLGFVPIEATPASMSAHQPRQPGEPGIQATKPSFLEELASPIIGKPGERTMLGRAIYGREEVAQLGQEQTDSFNKPLVRFEEFLPEGKNLGGVTGKVSEFGRGALRTASEMTTPAMATELAAIGVFAKVRPVVARLISGGFSGQMLYSLYQQAPEFKRAVDAGDLNSAANIAGSMTATGAFAGMTGKHALTRGKPVARPIESPAEAAPVAPVEEAIPPAEIQPSQRRIKFWQARVQGLIDNGYTREKAIETVRRVIKPTQVEAFERVMATAQAPPRPVDFVEGRFVFVDEKPLAPAAESATLPVSEVPREQPIETTQNLPGSDIAANARPELEATGRTEEINAPAESRGIQAANRPSEKPRRDLTQKELTDFYLDEWAAAAPFARKTVAYTNEIEADGAVGRITGRAMEYNDSGAILEDIPGLRDVAGTKEQIENQLNKRNPNSKIYQRIVEAAQKQALQERKVYATQKALGLPDEYTVHQEVWDALASGDREAVRQALDDVASREYGEGWQNPLAKSEEVGFVAEEPVTVQPTPAVQSEGSWDIAARKRHEEHFVNPVRKKLASKPWTTSAELRNFPPFSKMKKEGNRAVSDTLNELKKSGELQIAWNREGIPYYALKDAKKPSNLLNEEQANALESQSSPTPPPTPNIQTARGRDWKRKVDNMVDHGLPVEEAISRVRESIFPRLQEQFDREILGKKSEKPVDLKLVAELERIKAGTKVVGDTAKDQISEELPPSLDSAEVFVGVMDPMQKARARKALDVSVMNKGRAISRQALVEEKVKDGARIVMSPDGKRRLQTPDGSYLDESQISKTAMDYAEHRIQVVKRGEQLLKSSAWVPVRDAALKELEKSEPTTIADFSKQAAEAYAKEQEGRVNELAKQGISGKARVPTEEVRGPLFGNEAKEPEQQSFLGDLLKSESGEQTIRINPRQIDFSGIAETAGDRGTIAERISKKTGQYWDRVIRRYYDQFIPIRRLTQQVYGKAGAREMSAEIDPYKQLRIAFGGIGGKVQSAYMDYVKVVEDSASQGLADGLTRLLKLKAMDRAILVVQEKLGTSRENIKTLREQVKTMNRQIRQIESEKGEFGVRDATKLEALKNHKKKLEAELRDTSIRATRYERELKTNSVVPPDADKKPYTRERIQAEIDRLAEKAGEENMTRISDLAGRVFELNRRYLDLEMQSGVLNYDQYEKFTKRGDEYVPTFREHEDVPQPENIQGGGGFQAKHLEKSLEGGQREMIDPIEASMMKAQSVIKQAEKNRVVKNFVKWLKDEAKVKEQGEMVRVTPIRELKGREEPGPGKGAITYMENGEVMKFEVDQLLADTINLADASIGEPVGKAFLQFFTNIGRAGMTTANLAFSLPNVIRDIKDMAVLSQVGFRRPQDAGRMLGQWLQAVKDQVEKDPAFREYLESGAAYSTMQSNISPETFLGKPASGFGGRLRQYSIGKIEEFNNVLENATKLMTYKRSRQSGMSKDDAAWETRNYGGSPDFGSKGTRSGATNLLFMFFNARLQGTGRTLAGVARDPVKIGGILAAYTAAQAGLQAWNNQFTNPDGSKEWDHISNNDKRNYILFIRPDTYTTSNGSVRNRVFKVPKSHFEQMFLNPIQDLIAGITGSKVDPLQTGLDVISNASPANIQMERGTVARDIGAGIASSLNPVIKEVGEQASNYDTFRKMPIVSKGKEALDPRYQYGPTTSEASRAAGELTGIAPQRVEHAVRGFTGGLGETGLSIADKAFKEANPAPLEGDEALAKTFLLGPIIRRFVGSTSDQVYRDKLEKFYDAYSKAQTARATVSFLRKSNREELKQYISDPTVQKLFKAEPTMQKASGMLTRLTAEIKRVQGDTKLSDEEKKQEIRSLFSRQVKLIDKVTALIGVQP